MVKDVKRFVVFYFKCLRRLVEILWVEYIGKEWKIFEDIGWYGWDIN